jgi:hypothetical protein
MLNSSSPLGLVLKVKVQECSHGRLIISLDSTRQITLIRAEYFPKLCQYILSYKLRFLGCRVLLKGEN